ncbi:transmembrane 178A [Babesia ovata]|uniref:Transmembrane 178A n=1 Tax=Babesia ovata TaxID=189622 RepID=A0A2H6K6B0_9APIC|nr:transmembrane 178A [Babesia ovata]GBE58526.1 transmembrane 178A [Babesia ovata]
MDGPAPSEAAPDNAASSVQSVPTEIQSTPSPEGAMVDVELSAKRVVNEGYVTWLKPWFDLSQSEYGRRCKACLISYMCLNFTCVRLLELASLELRSMYRSAMCRMGLMHWFPEETLDVSTAGPDAQVEPAEEAPKDFLSPVQDEGGVASIPVGEMDVKGAPGSTDADDASDNFGLGALEGYCDTDHHIFLTLRNMWRKPDLYAPFWINVMMSGSLFKIYALHQYYKGIVNSVLSLSMLLYFMLICWSCSFLMALAIYGCRIFVCGSEGRTDFLPILSVSGYMRIPLVIFCKVIVWISVARVYMPSLSGLIYVLQYLTYAYFCASTSATVSLYLPPAPDPSKDTALKVTTAVVTCLVQTAYFYWIEVYV